MTKYKLFALCIVALTFSLNLAAAVAVATYAETFNTNASGWLNGASAAPTYNATGGIANSGYISYSPATFNSGTGSFPGASPLQLMFRGNNTANASGDAFVGNWISDNVQSLSVAVRHNYTSTLNFYARIAGSGGAGASLADVTSFAIAPGTWTTLTIPITESNPPFSSFGSSNFNGVFSNVQNLQLGLYLPEDTDFTDLRMDLDNVAITVPEPASISLLGFSVGALITATRRRRYYDSVKHSLGKSRP